MSHLFQCQPNMCAQPKGFACLRRAFIRCSLTHLNPKTSKNSSHRVLTGISLLSVALVRSWYFNHSLWIVFAYSNKLQVLLTGILLYFNVRSISCAKNISLIRYIAPFSRSRSLASSLLALTQCLGYCLLYPRSISFT